MAKVLWKRINLTDFKAMSGLAAPSGTGGGARHVVLGKSKPSNDIASFLPPLQGEQITINTEAGPSWPAATLTFSSNPGRRNGEWLIVDQKNNRHPAWTVAAGFPTAFDGANPPVVLVVETNGAYHVAWLDAATFQALAPSLASAERGVSGAPTALLASLSVQKPALAEFEDVQAAQPAPEYNPANQEDARTRILAEVVRRQGQRAFRKKLLAVYKGTCAVTRCTVLWVLEAAHISPYRGPDTNKADNGLLLRADIHTLFDLGLLSVDPGTLKVRVSGQVLNAEYQALNGKSLTVGTVQPSTAALQEHWSRSTA